MAERERMRGENPYEKSDRMLRELSADLKIDKHDLDNELVHQPELYHKAGQEYAAATSYRDEAKDDRDGVKADLDFKLRREAEKEGKKLTEALITNMIIGDDKYRDANRIYQDWTRLASRWVSLREDFHSRGFVLRELVTLWVNSYYQSNSETRSDARDRVAERVKQARAEELTGSDRFRRSGARE